VAWQSSCERWRNKDHHSGAEVLFRFSWRQEHSASALRRIAAGGFAWFTPRGDHSLRVVSLSRTADRAVGPRPDDGELTKSDAGGSERHSMSHSVIDPFDRLPARAIRLEAAAAHAGALPMCTRSLARTPALLWGALSVTAGSADVISFLGLGVSSTRT
jgi:hypothetical protein